MTPDIEIRNLSVWFDTPQGPVAAVDGVSTVFRAGRISGLIGESGSGKSVMGLSILRLLPNTARVEGECLFGGEDLYHVPLSRMREVRGAEIGLIPQNPSASLDPVMKLRRQLAEALTAHGTRERSAVEAETEALLGQFGFERPRDILDGYAFQMSGGMNQRLVSALGLAAQPGWVIADEPTKGLDAVLRNQVYGVLRDIYAKHHSSMLVITHDLHLARRLCDDLRVLYMGQIVEQNSAETLMERPRHPYTRGLLESMPSRGMR
ncbi:MAG: ABC transporter ATP-binding protein, partial [Oscillospiraceae bacterium]